MSFELTRESWRTVWPEARELAAQHMEELGEQRMELDEGLLEAANDCGAFHIFGARSSGKLIGYICWSVGRHPERKGFIMAQQGPWFALRGTSCGLALFKFALEELAAIGVHIAYPHSRWNARGERLENFFKTIGATPLQITYELDLRSMG